METIAYRYRLLRHCSRFLALVFDLRDYQLGIAVGSGIRPIVISPVTNNILITIIGMFFGNQITKR